ncbi:MAG TPA: hypothetical protein VHH34_19755 [Pseudonocardiaceae bacterium]|nr:hypothetical protein [Pseudonocardiaceae bacterium]
MSPEAIGAIFTGLTGLVAALAAYAANRGRRTAADVHALRRRLRRVERISAAAVGHIFHLEMLLSGHGYPVPARPNVLDEFYADVEMEEKDDVAQGSEERRYGSRA